MTKFKEGDRVRLVTRAATEEDLKSNTYFEFYGGLTGTVSKVYGANEAAVEIEQDSLTRDIRKRHEEVRDQMKTKWLEGLSEEGRSKLTEREKDFVLRYVILAKLDDLERAGAKPVTSAQQASASAAPQTSNPQRARDSSSANESEPGRMTLADIEAAEEAELRRRQGG